MHKRGIFIIRGPKSIKLTHTYITSYDTILCSNVLIFFCTYPIQKLHTFLIIVIIACTVVIMFFFCTNLIFFIFDYDLSKNNQRICSVNFYSFFLRLACSVFLRGRATTRSSPVKTVLHGKKVPELFRKLVGLVKKPNFHP